VSVADLSSKCPGKDTRFLKIEELACPECGYRVEFFSDERARKCPECGHKVDRTRESNCAEWCPAAASCALLRGAPSDADA
jgi:DNA-directed RNA polymerase subunit RPC12/RpoP